MIFFPQHCNTKPSKNFHFYIKRDIGITIILTLFVKYRIAPSNAKGDFYYMTGVFRTSEERVTIVEEQTVYTFDELIADIGGGLGTGYWIFLNFYDFFDIFWPFCNNEYGAITNQINEYFWENSTKKVVTLRTDV